MILTEILLVLYLGVKPFSKYSPVMLHLSPLIIVSLFKANNDFW